MTTTREAVALARRWLWLVAGLPAAVVALSLAMASPGPQVRQARLSFAIDVPPELIVPGSDEGSAAKIGEALIDDISRVISGDVFAAEVAARLGADVPVTAGQIASSLSATDRHRTADLTVSCAAPPAVACPPAGAPAAAIAAVDGDLLAIADAVMAELEEDGPEWFARLGGRRVALTVYDRPDVVALPPSLRARLELPLRALLALAVALGGALLGHALDDRVRSDEDARRATAAPLLGRIPRHG